MGRRDTRDRFRKLVKTPSTYLAYRGLRAALMEAGQSLRSVSDGFVIFVVPGGYRAQDYELAAYALIGADSDEWAPRPGVCLANPPRKKGSSNESITVFGLHGLAVLIARNIDEVPKDVRFAAAALMFVEPPAPSHIHAARRFSGKPPISEEHALLLVGKPQSIVVAAILRRDFRAQEIAVLEDLERPHIEGPNLFELPGYEEAKLWATGLRSDVARWRGGELRWKEVGSSALLSGPPGTGKTFFASALAKALGMRLIGTTIGEWQSAGHLGDTLQAMRACFEEANDGRGAVLFIDELDSIGTRSVSSAGDSNNHYWRNVLNEFLNLLSRLGEGVIVVGATNFPEYIDPAVKRAGRLEHHFTLPLPDKVTRAEILNYHAEGNFPLECLAEIAEDLEGKSGSALEQLVRDARKKARDENRELELRDLRAQLPERISYTPEELLRLAVHEAGHALVSLSVGYATSATIEIKDSFDPSAPGYLGGMASYELTEDHLPTETSLLNRIAVALAGMAAEAAVFGDRSVGSGGIMGSDIERATSLARRMVGTYGFGSKPVFLGTVQDLVDAPLPERFENEALDIVGVQYDRVLKMLADERDRVLALATEAVNHRALKIERGG
ncbi:MULTISPECIES: AAA family ATPase [unclassified Sinorhizobium]|uniref:AAA family ATPase n=1 Tax=unclassified Sinorhizobium TaxID=2613772 RepID=UPI0024C3CD59|nr:MULTISPECIES: AAA family ATPase [unclassified Sinorhizobium]MDK1376834.1 AAA family ATPase [Sinorhizobium sp. 6-70]MDK1481065.1 AAA family ATPase [Sinorhizobium sp. 6-117]